MTEPIDDKTIIEDTDYSRVMVFQVGEGEFIIFPNGVKSIAERYEAEAIAVNPEGEIEVLRQGFSPKDPMAWVSVVTEYKEKN